MRDIALICSVIPARFPLLRRSLITWQKSILESGLDAHIYLYIEGATIAEAMKYIPVGTSVSLAGGEERSGSHIRGYNYWYKEVDAKVYLFSHGEILFPKDVIATAFTKAVDDTYVAFKCFWINIYMTSILDTMNWRNPEELEKEPLLFTDAPHEKETFYDNGNIRSITCWESSTSYAINRQTAEKLYPLPDFGKQGADDCYQVGARQRLGIKNITVMDPVLVHQWHPNSWFGTGEEAIEEATKALQERFGG